MIKYHRRLMSLFLSIVLLLVMVPVVSAEEETPVTVSADAETYDTENPEATTEQTPPPEENPAGEEEPAETDEPAAPAEEEAAEPTPPPEENSAGEEEQAEADVPAEPAEEETVPAPEENTETTDEPVTPENPADTETATAEEATAETGSADELENAQAGSKEDEEETVPPASEENEIADEAQITVLEPEELVYINPLYRDVMTEADLEQSPGKKRLRSAAKGSETEEPVYCTTQSELAADMRTAMCERRTDYVGYYRQEERVTGAMVKAAYEEANMHTGAPTEGDYIHFQLGGYKGNLSGFSQEEDGVTYYYYTITLTITYYTTQAQEAEMDAAVERLVSELGLAEMESDLDKVAAIYGYMVTHISYDYTNLNNDSYKLKYTAYAALINHTAVCQGYSNLFYRLALRVGVDTRIVSSQAMNHAWNIVSVDEDYYYLDSTWDAGRRLGNYSYFLRGTASWPGTNHDTGENIDDYIPAIPQTDYSRPFADPNGDGSVDIRDVHLMRGYVSNRVPYRSSVLNAAMDISQDGRVNVVDVNLLRRYTVGLYSLPAA